jgi:superfamily I DNA/RNA helicase
MQFDALILDEAQDCLEPSYLDFIGTLLPGGLEDGNWFAFGDFARQAIYEQTPGSVDLGLAYLRSLSVSVRLRSNCRNPPRIAALVRLIAGLEPDYDEVLRPDDGREATWLFYKNPAEGRALLSQQLTSLLAAGVRERDVVVLSPRRDDDCLASSTSIPGRTFTPLRAPQSNGIRFGSIHAFKGLEARVIVLTDVPSLLGPKAQDLFYVGITRAQTALIILAEDPVRSEMARVLFGASQGRTP